MFYYFNTCRGCSAYGVAIVVVVVDVTHVVGIVGVLQYDGTTVETKLVIYDMQKAASPLVTSVMELMQLVW